MHGPDQCRRQASYSVIRYLGRMHSNPISSATTFVGRIHSDTIAERTNTITGCSNSTSSEHTSHSFENFIHSRSHSRNTDGIMTTDVYEDTPDQGSWVDFDTM